MTNLTPIPNGDNGRDIKGRFSKGNRGGPGNPYTKRIAELRSAIFDSITPKDLSAIIAIVLEKAKLGDLMAAKLILSYVGSPEIVSLHASQHETESREAFRDEIMEAIPPAKMAEILRKNSQR